MIHIPELEYEEIYPDTALDNITSDYIQEAIQKSKEDMSRFVADEFFTEAFAAATQLKHTIGDGDALAYELSETIRSNLIVLAQAMAKDPVAFVSAVLRASQNKSEIIERIDSLLQAYKEGKIT